MKRALARSNFAGLFRTVAIFAFLIFLSIVPINGQTTTFAQFIEQNGTQDFVFTNNTTNGSFNTVAGGSAISFRYQNLNALLHPALQGFQDAHLTITTTTTQVATAGPFNQPLNQLVTIQIIRDTPAPVGRNSRTNLLTAVFTPNTTTPGITGSGSSATLNASTPDHNVTFTSDFLLFHQTTARNLGLSFSSVTPALAIGAGGFLESFTAAGSGTFASNPLPSGPGATAGEVTISGNVSTANGEGLRGASVILLTSDGRVHAARTGNGGFFEFNGIAGGQAVVISVRAKNLTFSSQTISLVDNATGLSFVPEP